MKQIAARAPALPPTSAISDVAARHFCGAIALRLDALQSELSQAVAASANSTEISQVEKIIAQAKQDMADQVALLVAFQQSTQENLLAINTFIAGIDERIYDQVSAILQQGTGITLTPDDTTNTLTIEAAPADGLLLLE